MGFAGQGGHRQGIGWLLSRDDTEQCLWKGAEQLAALLTAQRRQPGGQLVMVGSSGRSCWDSASVRNTCCQTCPGEIKAEPSSYSLRFARCAAFNCRVSIGCALKAEVGRWERRVLFTGGGALLSSMTL